ncbi:MAG: type II secretion system protein [Lachnospiraceae bacterium]|nr:type II secretion system protein [Lachnospiraceae bacterium]MDY4164667.1 type II secretion system protein [Lachnospiraceae bacterium]
MKKNDSGFTLVELICVIAILGLITVSIFTFILSGMGMANETKKSAALSENSRIAINKMKTDIMNCSGGVVGSEAITTSDGSTLNLNSADYNGGSEELGDNFYLLKREDTGNTYTVKCYKYVSGGKGKGKIYYGKAKGVAITDSLDSGIESKCSPTHVICDYVTDFHAYVVPVGETVVLSDGSSKTETQIKAKRVHIDLSLDKGSKSFDTRQDAAIRSDVRYFSSFKEASSALNN